MIFLFYQVFELEIQELGGKGDKKEGVKKEGES